MHVRHKGHKRPMAGQGVHLLMNVVAPLATLAQAAMCWLDADKLQQADTCFSAAFACVCSSFARTMLPTTQPPQSC